jgi:hypothetical protein
VGKMGPRLKPTSHRAAAEVKAKGRSHTMSKPKTMPTTHK